MCRSIKRLRVDEAVATDEEVRAAALQFVRKISGYYKPPQARTVAFDVAIEEVAAASRRLLGSLEPAPAT